MRHPMLKHLALLSCTLFCVGQILPVDERGNIAKVENKFRVGADAAVTFHSEAGLDSSKGEYGVSDTTFGGSALAQYHFQDFYLEGGVGIMRLLSLTVNGTKVDMANRVQWHIPVFARGYYKLTSFMGVGVGLTHLTETTMYLNSNPVPNSSYHHIFLDLAAQVTPQLNDKLWIVFTFIFGLNMIPGRQHTYSVGDLLHVRAQFNVGAAFALF
jgi:hypothetical protein